MNFNNLETTKYTIEQYFRMATSFVFVKFGLLLIKHPLSMIQVNKQAYPNISNIQLIQNIYQKNGLLGFYRATPTSMMKMMLSESYRGPLMIATPRYVEKCFNSMNSEHKFSQTLITIGVISLIDSTLTCPMLRLLTHRYTQAQDSSMRAIIKNYLKAYPLKEFYRGYSALFIQTMNLWGIFFIFDDSMKFLIKKYSGGMSYSALTICSAMMGFLQATMNIIPDTIRIQMQKSNNHDLNFRQTFQYIIKNHGRLSFFNSLPHRFVSQWIGFLYKSLLREYWENQNDKLYQSSPKK